MLTTIPLTVVPLILFNAIGFAVGAPNLWTDTRLTIPLVSGHAWSASLGDLMILLGLLMLFFETLRSARPGLKTTIGNHVISTVLLIVYVVEFIVVGIAANSTFLILTAIALFDVVAGFSISIRTAERDVSLGPNAEMR